MASEKVEYQKARKQNEADANRQMSYINAAAGVLAIVIWLLYLLKVFTIPAHFYLTVIILFPCIALLMFAPLFFVKTKAIERPGYKYFILFSLLAVIIALNITVPKHSLLFWPFAILIANHYYNPTLGRVIFAVALVSMLICMYVGMFFGEFDENLFGGGVVKEDGSIGTVETFQERVELLDQLRAAGNNRYVKVLIYYFFPRAMIVTLFFLVSNALNRRTYTLLDKEITIHDQQERAKTELNVAKDIQLNTLPSEIVDDNEVEIIGGLKAANEVGGDLYDYVDIDKDHVAVLIGDVSGKGVPAAMFMMKTITSFRDFAAPNKTPSTILKEVNAAILNGNKNSMFVTCILAILDKTTGKVVYTNAGHNPPIIGTDGHYKFLDIKPSFFLGVFKDLKLVDAELTLKPGESLTLYTDGITEARNEEGQLFGNERLINFFNKRGYNCTMELHHAMKEEIANFVGNAPQSDDITFVTMKYVGGKYAYKEKTFAAKKENVPKMLDFIADFAEVHKIDEVFKNQLLIVGDEVFSNIINHGYKNNGGEIFAHQSFDKKKKEYVLTVIDAAPEFNQLTVNNEEYKKDDKNPPVGGFGIMLLKKIMSECSYDRINQKNILILKKTLK